MEITAVRVGDLAFEIHCLLLYKCTQNVFIFEKKYMNKRKIVFLIFYACFIFETYIMLNRIGGVKVNSSHVDTRV